jgi:hypothetical protein
MHSRCEYFKYREFATLTGSQAHSRGSNAHSHSPPFQGSASRSLCSRCGIQSEVKQCYSTPLNSCEGRNLKTKHEQREFHKFGVIGVKEFA